MKNREFNSLEKAFFSLDIDQPFIIIICIHIRGILSFEQLVEAVTVVQQRHYYLNCTIARKNDDLFWVYDKNL
ncbi:MAG TPA: hypothetical protein PKK94_13910, partial [Leptospiraceae bacterium]|nr:hypothetical protein [Leptospiraceae bacterium]